MSLEPSQPDSVVHDLSLLLVSQLPIVVRQAILEIGGIKQQLF